jgi:signal transduction histidine kinase/ActR/RegA family two-component response regulator
VPEWSFSRRLITGVMLMSLLAILTVVGSLLASRAIVADMAATTSAQQGFRADALALQLLGVEHIGNIRSCLLPGGQNLVPMALASSADFRRAARALSLKTEDSGIRALVEAVLSTERALQDALEGALATRTTGHETPSAGSVEAIHVREVEFRRTLTSLVVRAESDWQISTASARRMTAHVQIYLIVVTCLASLLLGGICLALITGLNRSYVRQTTARAAAEHGQTAARATLSDVEAASHIKDEFLATVSHELRNPLAPILTWTQLLRSGTLDEEKTRRALEVIERNVMSQAQLIDDLVDVSRVVSGKFRLDVRPIDLVPVIKAAAESQTPASDAKQIRLQLVLDERAGMISGDSERLQQVMWNLISNAIKFTPKGGSVQVVLQRAESHVEVAVSDSGVGIEPGFLPHVFEPFRQGTGGSMRRHGGLGLGLSIVRHIVELHGGEIVAYSEGPHLGSKFTIKFPLLATAQDVSKPMGRHPIARDRLGDGRFGRLDGIRVLIVEDESSASEALLVLFSSCGADARVASSAAEALAVFDVWKPDVVVSDIAMPGQDGYSLIRAIRLRPRDQGGGVPAVALTAYAKIEDRVSILGAGFHMYLSKPADPNELIAVVRSLAKRGSQAERPASS